MTRVIERNVPEAEKVLIHRECGSKIGYYQNEVQNKIVEDYGGGKDTYYFIICPGCGKQIEVKGY